VMPRAGVVTSRIRRMRCSGESYRAMPSAPSGLRCKKSRIAAA
jgi:hypothetical protein